MTDPITLEHLAAQSNERPVWIRVGQLIDGESNEVVRDAHVVFDAKEIRYVGTSRPSDLKQSAPDATLDDHTLLPCLIEAHAHAFLEGAPVDFGEREQYLRQPPATFLERAKARTRKILQCGIGAIRDAGDKHGVGLALASEAKHHVGKLSAAPYIDSPGPAIHHKGRYGAFMGDPIENHASPADCVAARVAAGADRIKLLVSGIINFKEGRVTTPPQMPIEEVRAIVEAARSHGRQTFAHASGTEGVEHSIEGGVNTVEHGFFITEEQLAKMRDRNIAWVPTFAPVQLQIDRAKDLGWDDVVVGHLKRIIDSHQAMLCRAHAMGVKIVAGSDAGSCGVPHGVGFLQELEQMERAGLPSMATLKSATSQSANVLAFPEKIGRIAPGYRARFILTRHDPSKSIKNLMLAKTSLYDGQAIESPDHLSTAGL